MCKEKGENVSEWDRKLYCDGTDSEEKNLPLASHNTNLCSDTLTAGG